MPQSSTPSQYCQPSDVRAPGATVEQISDGIRDASAEIDSYLNKRYKLPLVRWGADLQGAARRMARYYALADRGFNPANPADQMVVRGYGDAVAWLKEVVKPDGSAGFVDAIDSSPTIDEAGPLHSGETPRRWLWGSDREGRDC